MTSQLQPTAIRPQVQSRDLTTGSIPRHLIVFSLPMLAGSALQTAYSVVNAVWVGHGLGSAAMAAVTISFPVLMVMMAVAFGVTMASNVLASQSFGAKDFERLNRVVGNSLSLTVITSLLCVIIGHWSAEWLIRAMSTPSEVLPLAVSYLRLFIWSAPGMFGIFMMGSLLRGIGDSKTPVYFQAIFLVLQAILDPLFMFGWLGFPRLGLNGTAVATIITNFGALITLLFYLHRKRSIVLPTWRNLKIDWPTSWLTLKIGVPSMVQQSLVSIGMLIVVGLVNSFGKDAAAAFGVASRIDNFAFLPAMTIGMAMATLAGQNIGAVRYDRVAEVFKWGTILSCAITLVPSLLAVTFPRLLLRGFIADRHVIALGVGYLRIVGAGYVLFAILFASNGVINGAGRTFITTLITLIGLWGFRLPLAAYFSKSLNRLEGIWLAMVISFAVSSGMSLAYYFSGRWKQPLIGEPPEVAGTQDIAPLSDTPPPV